MARTTLPRNTEAGAAEAPQQLQQILGDPLKAKMLVFGDRPAIDKALKACQEAADVKAAIRHTVWIPDASVLSDEQRARYMKNGKAATAVGLNGSVVETLTRAQAQEDIFVEDAFLLAATQ